MCSKCHKFGHSIKYCRTQVPLENHNNAKGKGKVDIDKTRKEINQTWKKKEDENSGASGVEITQSNGEGDHIISN